jgi:hypothetical protein
MPSIMVHGLGLGGDDYDATHSCWLARQLANRIEVEQGTEQILLPDVPSHHLFLEL